MRRAAVLMLLAGCGSGKDSDSTRAVVSPPVSGTEGGTPTGTFDIEVVVDWTDDGTAPTDTDGDGIPDYGCDDTLDIAITDPLNATVWELGMAEDGPYGWTGEDCLNGYAAFAFCHGIGPVATLTEVTSCRAIDVVEGSTTLLDASKAPYLTYYVSDTIDCFAFGIDVPYYDGLGCIPMR